MDNIDSLLNSAFDFSYINKSEFPETEMSSIGILGGGTAGYLLALALKVTHPKLKVTIIESSKIPIIGVGESTTTEICPFLHHVLGFDPIEFINEVEPSLKLGIRFEWGKKEHTHFNFNFFAGHLYESYCYEGHTKNSNLVSTLMNNGKVPFLKDESGDYTSLLDCVPFAYHLDNKKFVGYLKRKILSAEIEIIDEEVESVELDVNGYVGYLKTKSNKNLAYDLYVDCSGFRSKILGEALNTDFISFEKTLITDTALTFNMPNNRQIDPYTSAITMRNGWCWKIPMQGEDHYGYVYSSKHCSEEEAREEIIDRFGPIDDHKKINFRTGRHSKAWNKNVFSLGNAYGFIEPLESTAIQTIISSTMLLCRLMPYNLDDLTSITSINKEIAATWDSFRGFLGVHYKFNSKVDSPFWEWCRENCEIGNAEEIVRLFRQRPPLSRGHYGTSTGYVAYEPLIFNAYSYDSILIGQNVEARKTTPQMTEEEYYKRINDYEVLSSKCIDLVELFESRALDRPGVMSSLFENPESWVAETLV